MSQTRISDWVKFKTFTKPKPLPTNGFSIAKGQDPLYEANSIEQGAGSYQASYYLVITASDINHWL